MSSQGLSCAFSILGPGCCGRSLSVSPLVPPPPFSYSPVCTLHQGHCRVLSPWSLSGSTQICRSDQPLPEPRPDVTHRPPKLPARGTFSLLQSHQRWLGCVPSARQTRLLLWAEKIHSKHKELFHPEPRPQTRAKRKREFNTTKDTLWTQ